MLLRQGTFETLNCFGKIYREQKIPEYILLRNFFVCEAVSKGMYMGFMRMFFVCLLFCLL